MRYSKHIRPIHCTWTLPSDENVEVRVTGELFPSEGDGWNEPREPSYVEITDVKGMDGNDFDISDADLADIQMAINELSSSELEDL